MSTMLLYFGQRVQVFGVRTHIEIRRHGRQTLRWRNRTREYLQLLLGISEATGQRRSAARRLPWEIRMVAAREPFAYEGGCGRWRVFNQL